MTIYLFKCLLIFLILLSPSLFSAIKFNIRIEKVIPMSFMIQILILYLGGLCGFLKQTAMLSLIISLILFALFLFNILKNKKSIKSLFSPSILIFLLFYCILIFFHYGRVISGWDEFSHWGDVVKAMFTINDFSTNPSSLSYFQSYLPGISIFQYYFQFIYNDFNEGLLYIAYQIFAFSLFLPFTIHIKENERGKIIMFLIISLLLPLIFTTEYYKSIYVDSILGLIFGYLLYSIYSTKYFNKFNFLNLLVTASVLLIVKDIAIVLFAVYGLIIFYDFLKRKENGNNLTFIKFISLILVPLVFLVIWKIHVELTGANVVFNNPIDIKEILFVFLRQDTTYRATVLNNFLDALYSKNIISNLLPMNFYSLLGISCLFLYLIFRHEDNKRMKFFSIIIIAGCFLYTFANLTAYLSKFNEYEALNLNSFDRYIGIYFISVFMFVACYLIQAKKINSVLIILYLLFIGFTVNISNIPLAFYDVNKSVYQRSYFLTSYKILSNELGEKKARIYFICQESNGFEWWQLKFVNREFLSEINTVGSFRIGTKSESDDIYTKIISASDWSNELFKDFDYVYLYSINDTFINDYGILFEDGKEIKSNKLYYVDRENRKLVSVN